MQWQRRFSPQKRVEINKRPHFRMGDKDVCTPAWIRTKDQLIKSQLLYQLSYRGIGVAEWLKGTCAQRGRNSAIGWGGKAKNFRSWGEIA